MTDFELFESLFHLDEETGKLYWKISKPKVYPGMEAGHQDKTGYRRICVNYKMYLAHRIVFLLTRKRWPTGILDHADRDPSNNRPWNLRESDHSENGLNSDLRADNTHGYKGLCYDSRADRWYARKRGKYLGCFKAKAEAILAYEAAP